MILEFSVKEQTIEMLPTTSVPRSGSRKYLELRFHLSEEWNSMLPTAFLQYESDFEPVPMVGSNTFVVPNYFSTKPYFQLFLLGIDGDQAVPTNVITVNLAPSGEVWTSAPSSPDAPDYQVLIQLVQKAINNLDNSKALKAFEQALINYAGEDALVGLPVLDTGNNRYSKMFINGTQEEMDGDRNSFRIPTEGRVVEMIENAGIAIARGQLNRDDIYYAVGDNLPVVQASGVHHWIGKGEQIIFIPDRYNAANPSLSINGSDPIEIRMRGSGEDLTEALPAGTLREGVPYTMTFCGMYWLLDSVVGVLGGLREFETALEIFRDSDLIGLPVYDPDRKGYRPAHIYPTDRELENPILYIPTEGQIGEMIREAVLSGYIDVTEDYEKALEAGTVACAKEYLWTLGEGRYSLVEGSEKWYLNVFIGEFSEEEWRQTKRILLRVGEFINLEIHSINGVYTRTPDIMIDGETGHIYQSGRLFRANLKQTDPRKNDYVEGRELIGDLGALQTKNKDSLVDAINEAAKSGGGGETVTDEAKEQASLGEELISDTGWITEGWTGSLENGFTHIAGNTSPLVYTMPVSTGTKLYQISFECSSAIGAMSLFVSIGGSEQFDLYGQEPSSFGVRSISDGNLEFIPTSTFTSTISNISVREIIDSFEGVNQIKDSNRNVVFEIRPTSADKNNIFMGTESGEMNTSGYGNASLGSKSLKNNTSGFWNIGVGYEALRENTSGTRNIGIGYGALQNNECGHRNIGIGSFSLINNKTGNWNVAIGADNSDHNESGNYNVGVGFQSLYKNKEGSNNIALGYKALSEGDKPNYNVAIGDTALKDNSGSYNVAIGKSALQYNPSGVRNMAIGGNSLYRSTGNSNAAIGYNALKNVTNGNNNIGIGVDAGCGLAAYSNATDNVFIGAGAGSGTSDGASYNVMIGKNAGAKNATGTNNILIGYNVDTDNVGDSRRLNIGGLLKGFLGEKKYLTIDGDLDVSKLPISDPKSLGRVWNDNGVLRVSGFEGGGIGIEGGSSGIEVSGAEVGQFLKVAAVDENGVPTAWEAADPPMPSWKHLRTVTIPEDITTDMSGARFYESSDGTGINFGFDADKNGNRFAVNELFIYCQARNSAPGTGTKEAALYSLSSTNSSGYCYQTAMQIGCAESSTHQTAMCAKCHIIGIPGCIFGWAVSGGGATASTKTRQQGSQIPVPFTSVRLLPEYNASFGFLPGSKFIFYGR